MIIEVDRDDLLAALRGLKPALRNKKSDSVRLVATGDRIQFHAGSRVRLATRVPGNVTEEGSGWLHHRTAEALVRQLPRLPVRVTSGTNDALNLESAGGRFSLTPPVDMTEIDEPDPPFAVSCVLPVEAFNAISVARGFASNDSYDSYRPLLVKVLLEAQQDAVSVVATNGHIMAEVSLTVPAAVAPFTCLLPPEVTAALGVGNKGADALELSVAPDGWHRLRWNRTDCVWRADDGEVYPNWRQVFPGKPVATWEVGRADLTGAAKRISVLLKKSDPLVSVSFNGVGGIFTRDQAPLLSISQVVGGTYTGPDDFSFGIGAFYLHQIASRFSGAETLRLSLVSPERAIVVEDATPPNSAVVSKRFLVMPMRVHGSV